MNDGQVPDTIGVSLGSRENLKRASESLTLVQIPGYTLTQELGRGSFGSVWKATRQKTGQSVAVKILDQGENLNWDYLRRELDFLKEIEEHPHTLTVLDAQLDSEPPYIVMPLAEGGSLAEVVNGSTPDQQAVEKWLQQTAEALAFIHKKGVIHCDLKPSNVLLSSSQDVRVADLGQARRQGHGLALGTIGFMAPEQCAEGSRTSPSVGWDVYGFGATAYWLLSGKIPRLEGERPPTVEEYLDCLQSRPVTPLRELAPRVDPELAAIVESCLEADPERRIPTMDAVLTDLQRRKRNEPLLCRRPWKFGYLAGVALKRRTVRVALMLAALICVAAYLGWQSRNENRYLALLTDGIHAHESGRLEQAYLNWLEALRYRPRSEALQQRLHFMPLQQIFPHGDRVNDLLLLEEDATLVTASADGELALWDSVAGDKLVSFPHPAHLSQVVASPDGSLLATGAWDGRARVFDTGSRRMVQVVSHEVDGYEPSIISLEFTDGGRSLATADLQGRLKLWESRSGRSLPLQGPPANPEVRQVLAAHPHHPLLAALVDPETAALWDVKTGKLLPHRFSHAREINALVFSPDGNRLLSASDDGTAAVWSLDTGARVDSFAHESRVNALIALDETRFATGCEDGSAVVWDLSTGSSTHQFFHRRPVRSLGLSPDGGLLAVGTGESENLWSDVEANGTVEVWDLERGVQVAGPWPHDGPVERVVFSSHHPVVLSASGSARQSTAVYPGAVRAWRYHQPSRRALASTATNAAPKPGRSEVLLDNGLSLSHGENVVINQFTSHPGRGLTATASEDRTVRLWLTHSGESMGPPILLNGPAVAAAFCPDGKVLATVSETPAGSSVVRLWEVDSGYPTSPDLVCPEPVRRVEISHNGSTLNAYTDQFCYSWTLAGAEADWTQTVGKRLRARLDHRGEVTLEPGLSESVMTVETR